MKECRWILPERAQAEAVERLALGLKLPPAIAGLLLRRGISTEAEGSHYLSPKLKTLSDPFLLPNMREAVSRIQAALRRNERIVLYGDYDVDGMTSLTIFYRILTSMGGKVSCFLPSRMDEGYGVSKAGVARCIAEQRPQLLVAVDCGTSAAAEIEELLGQGIDVVIFDHHETKGILPRCPLVNPKLGSDFEYLCSAGIAFKACHALLKEEDSRPADLRDFLDIVALGTVADIVPLVGENRLLVQKGLEQMGKTRWAGLQALMEVAGVRAPVRPVNVGFHLGPRLNAAGRLGPAREALELLLTDDFQRARKLAANLDAHNKERQSVEQQTVRDAEQFLSGSGEVSGLPAVVCGGDGWHPGVVGIVAARLSRSYYRPAIVVGFDEEGVGRGSGRSVEGFSLVKALAACGEQLEKYGGHEMAAGLTVKRENFDAFRVNFLEYARQNLDLESLCPSLHLDAEVRLSDLSFDFLSHHDALQPFGTGNPQPMFIGRRVAPCVEPVVLKEKHLRLELLQNGSRHQAIWFNSAGYKLPPPPWDVAFGIERNEYNGNVRLQLQVHAVRSAN